VQELSAKNDELTSEMHKLRTAVNSSVLRNQPVTSRHVDSGQGHFSFTVVDECFDGYSLHLTTEEWPSRVWLSCLL